MVSKRFLELSVSWVMGVALGIVAMGSAPNVGVFSHPNLVDPMEYSITIGPDEHPECQTDVTLAVWDDMNRMGLWAWPVACVAAREAEAP